jgi:hypothetical protein
LAIKMFGPGVKSPHIVRLSSSIVELSTLIVMRCTPVLLKSLVIYNTQTRNMVKDDLLNEKRLARS